MLFLRHGRPTVLVSTCEVGELCEGAVEGTAAEQTTAQTTHGRRRLRPIHRQERGECNGGQYDWVSRTIASTRRQIWRGALKPQRREERIRGPPHHFRLSAKTTMQICFVTWRGRRAVSGSPTPRRSQSPPPPPPDPIHTKKEDTDTTTQH